jgi:DNA invertase Pin-like site-specific DNA recombinase
LREFAAKQGWQIVRECIDHETGSKSDRAEFQAMFADASRRTGYPAKAHWKRSSTCHG